MRRSKEQILEEILNICLCASGKTAIVYQCNLNFSVANKHLNNLIDADLIKVSKNNGSLLYVTTEKGIKALEVINEYKELLKSSKASSI